MFVCFFNEALLLGEGKGELQEKKKKKSALHGNWVSAYISEAKVRLKLAGRIFYLTIKKGISSVLNLYSCYNNLWYKKEKNSPKLSLEEMDETLTPVHLWETPQSASESVAHVGKSEFSRREMSGNELVVPQGQGVSFPS